MRIPDYFHMAFKALKDRKLRSVLTVLGIVIGSAMIVALIASTSGLSASVSRQIDKMGVTTLNVVSTSIRTPIKDEDVAFIRDLNGVKDVIPYFSRRLSINYGSNTLSVSLVGLDQTKLQSLYKGLEISEGTIVDGYDPTGVVVGSAISNPPSNTFPPVGINEMVALQGTATGRGAPPSYTFIVRGVLAPYGAVGFTNLDETVFTTLAARTIFSVNYYTGLYVIAESPSVVDSVVESIQNYFGGNARVFSSSALLQTVQSITTQLTIFLGGVAVVTLFVAAVGITNTMFVSVMERTREIGILKALGYSPKQILSLFLAEATLTGILGSIFGTMLGVGLSFFLGGGIPTFRFPSPPGARAATGQSSYGAYAPVFSPELIMFSLLFPIGIAVLAGLYPAWRASRMNAVTALKYE
ncbi:MAG: ABC transporter permease [Candidatus Bathyarchaeia archaeon]